MSTTDTDVVGAITLTEDELDPYITHTDTRQWLTGPGLPAESTLLGFGALREHGLRKVADLAGDADKLAAELQDQLVVEPCGPSTGTWSRSSWTGRRGRSPRRTSSPTRL